MELTKKSEGMSSNKLSLFSSRSGLHTTKSFQDIALRKINIGKTYVTLPNPLGKATLKYF